MTMSGPIGKSEEEAAFATDLDTFRAALDLRLAGHVSGGPARLIAAARDAALSPGKRMRPYLVHLIARGPDTAETAVLDAGAAVEMVHAASLILDDLPCMDDARLRRSRPTTHVAFGEATAILAAVGLLNGAYAVIAGMETVPEARRLRLTAALSRAVGWQGLVGGQELDLNGFGAAEAAGIGRADRIREVNRRKTCHLLVAAVQMGAVLAGLNGAAARGLERFASDLGQAFQIADDLADGLLAPEEAGKDTGKDAGKATLVAEIGPEAALRLCLDLLLSADAALMSSGVDPVPLRRLTAHVIDHDLLAARLNLRRSA